MRSQESALTPVRILVIQHGGCFLRREPKRLNIFLLLSNKKNANADLFVLQVNRLISEVNVHSDYCPEELSPFAEGDRGKNWELLLSGLG
jgi:hypothetical protein